MIELSESQKKELIKIARAAIESEFENNQKEVRKKFSEKYNKTPFNQKTILFVALIKKGFLGGRYGNIKKKVKLWEGVFDYAIKAAFSDKRFPMLRDGERYKIHISIASDPKKVLLKDINNGKGIIINYNKKESLFLPEVWEQMDTKEEFLIHLSVQARMGIYEWKKEDVVFKEFDTIEIYE